MILDTATEKAADARPAALSVRGVAHAFGAVRALRGVSFDVSRGEVLGLVGANGAGKTTLIRALTGDLLPDAGTVLVDGAPMPLGAVRATQLAGIGVVRQELDLVPELSVAENVFLAQEQPFVHRLRLDRRRLGEAARPLLSAVGLELEPAVPVSRLSIGDRQLVAAARAMRDAGRILLLDEPTSSLSPTEAERLFETVRVLARRGVAVVYISHRLDEIASLCDRVVVLRDGAVAGEYLTPERELDEIVRAMIPGLEQARHARRAQAARGPVALAVCDLIVGRHGPATFEVHAGEVLGLFGLVGAGRSTLARAIAGVVPATSGTVLVAGRPLHASGPHRALDRGVAYLSEDRKGESILPGLTIRSNICLRTPGDTARAGVLRPRRIAALADAMIRRLSIRTPSGRQPIEQLSGGNQQKVVLGRLLAEQVDVLVLDEPTHGIDVAAKQDLLQVLGELADAGKAVVLISSELPELIAASHRILVLRRGRVVRQFLPEDASDEGLMNAAAGASAA